MFSSILQAIELKLCSYVALIMHNNLPKFRTLCFCWISELLEHPLISMVRAESIDEGRDGAKHPTLGGGWTQPPSGYTTNCGTI
jgi:hypothetical protein